MYVGEVNDNKEPHGFGIMEYANDDENELYTYDSGLSYGVLIKYEGEWLASMRHGKGTAFFAALKDYYVSKYEGEWDVDFLEGNGTIWCANGDSHKGKFVVDGKREGKFVITYASGDKYEGDIKDGKYHGKGTLIKADGTIQSGDWLKGDFTIRDTIIFENGGKYVGNIITTDSFGNIPHKSKPHGIGVMEYINGDRYEGEFCGKYNGFKRDGNGVCYYGNGDTYDGRWGYDEPRDGVMICANGDRIEGRFGYNGFRTIHYANGDKFEGYFKYNKIDGVDTYTENGIGTYTYADGKIEKQDYLGGKRLDFDFGQMLIDTAKPQVIIKSNNDSQGKS